MFRLTGTVSTWKRSSHQRDTLTGGPLVVGYAAPRPRSRACDALYRCSVISGFRSIDMTIHVNCKLGCSPPHVQAVKLTHWLSDWLPDVEQAHPC